MAQDTASNPCPVSVDQRGIVRPQFDVCDRGAYEVAGYSNPNPIDIGANQCVTSPLTINDRFAVGRLLAGVNLTYPIIGTASRTDLTIRLLSPGTSRARLLGLAANSRQNLDTLFDDSATQGVPARRSKSCFAVLRERLPTSDVAGAICWRRCSRNLENGGLQFFAQRYRHP